jgi:hypothetical protein
MRIETIGSATLFHAEWAVTVVTTSEEAFTAVGLKP